MISHTTRRFRDALHELSEEVQRQAREAYRRFLHDPSYPGLRFKQVHPTLPIYSVRITSDYRAVGTRDGDDIVWFWVGTHADYEHVISRL